MRGHVDGCPNTSAVSGVILHFFIVDHFSETEVGDFEDFNFVRIQVNEDILGFDVPMKDTPFVQVLTSLCQLDEEVDSLWLLDVSSFFEKLLQISKIGEDVPLLAKLEEKIYII